MAEFPGITHVAVTVTDLAVSVPWYERLLGAKPMAVIFWQMARGSGAGKRFSWWA
jgi:catechol 2,3-dioxygenase-like lactoylglutathione lyase family enzyme